MEAVLNPFAAFDRLQRHHICTPAAPLPPAGAGITWLWAANGIFKRGQNQILEATICTGPAPIVPGLAQLLPSVRWLARSGRLPGALLGRLLENAQAATTGGPIARPTEKQYFYVLRERRLALVAPPEQDAGPGHVRYQMPEQGDVLIDIHSHHGLPGGAYFSPTDDHDDRGLSVSAVIGQIFTRPEIICRINVYGHRQIVPASMIFDSLGPFRDKGAPHAARD